MLCQVIRRFPGPDGMFERGAVVDCANFRERNLRGLIDRRYLAPIAQSPTDNQTDAQDAAADVQATLTKRRGRPPGSGKKPALAASQPAAGA